MTRRRKALNPSLLGSSGGVEALYADADENVRLSQRMMAQLRKVVFGIEASSQGETT